MHNTDRVGVKFSDSNHRSLLFSVQIEVVLLWLDKGAALGLELNLNLCC